MTENEEKTLLVLVGPKGSGKTRIAKLLETHLGVRFLRVEPVFREAYSEGRKLAAIYDALGERIAREFEETDSLVIESLGIAKDFKPFLVQLLCEYNVKLVRLRVPPEVCLKRARSPEEGGPVDVTDEQLRELNFASEQVEMEWDLEITNEDGIRDDAILVSLRPLLPPREGRS